MQARGQLGVRGNGTMDGGVQGTVSETLTCTRTQATSTPRDYTHTAGLIGRSALPMSCVLDPKATVAYMQSRQSGHVTDKRQGGQQMCALHCNLPAL